jgi:N-acetylneuraminic acid mutarotase
MKKANRLLEFAFFTILIIIFTGCKKDVEIPTLTTNGVHNVTNTTAETGGNVTSSGGEAVTVRGVCWSTLHNPTVTGSKTIDGSGSGAFTSSITELTENSTYYIRAYATNSVGTAYGSEISFTTDQNIIVATLSTAPITDITATSAVSGGNINSDGGASVTTRGICWGTDINPTISNNMTSDASSGIGYFKVNLVGLDPGTNYYIRAYAVNNAGISYGNEVTFTTPLTDPPGQKAYYPGGARYLAAGFSIGTKVYLGLGENGGDFPVKDFWEWDQATNKWTRKANFPGYFTGRIVSFTIGTKGYIGTEIHWSTSVPVNEFWEYDPATNAWTQKASIPTTPARYGAVGFSIGTKGYFGIGHKDDGMNDSYYKDFWEWDQAINVWTRKADFEGTIRGEAVGFSIGSKGYIGTGNGDTPYSTEFWEWDQATDVWTRKADFGGNSRTEAVGFSIGNKGYIGTGYGGSQTSYLLYNDFWEWDQTTDLWTRKANFGGGARSTAVGVSISNKGYLGTGLGGNIIYAYQDFWEYDPILK